MKTFCCFIHKTVQQYAIYNLVQDRGPSRLLASYILELAVRLREYAVHADYAHIRELDQFGSQTLGPYWTSWGPY